MPYKSQERTLKYQSDYRKTHKKQYAIYNQIHYQKQVKKVFDHYGNKCKCCGETIKEFLTIDHINGGGTKHRERIGEGSSFYKWIIKNNFPNDLRILCYNCNLGGRFLGYCPHQKNPK